MGSLTVFKASAGSGKTFSLAARFIGLLVSNPAAYKEILAVTFTTKATEEMKNRILSQLYGLAAGLRDSDVYLREITGVYGFSEAFVREQSRRALAFILHDYGNFNVETIDSFFQRVLRGIARELELNCNMRVELGQDEVEQLAVDRLLTNLRPNDKELAWIMDYIRQNILDDKKWNVLDGIREFGKKIFTDEYRENAKAIDEAMNKEGFFAAFRNKLRSEMDDAMSEMAAIGNEFFELLDAHGYSMNDFIRGKSGPAGYFAKLRDGFWLDSGKTFNASAANAAQNASAWLVKAKQTGAMLAFAENELMPRLARAEEQRQKAATRYLSASAVLANINEVRLLRKIEQGVEEVNKETNSLMLSDTQMLLRQLMEGSDAPFVYEKTGARISHIMIDEMQDTSVVQWENFKKLLLECLAREESQNLIVGDVKQSIYRWRNSDWRILNNIAEDKALKNKDLHIETLLTNYRSEPNIIAFNNAFFRLAAAQEQARLKADGVPGADLIGSIYSDGETQQQCGSGKSGGRVRVALLDKADYPSRCVEMIADHISSLLAAGVKEEDIAIIARRNKDLVTIGAEIERLLPDCRFASDEAFKLGSSVALNIIVNAMRVAAGIQPAFYSAILAWDYNVYILARDPAAIIFNSENIENLLPEAFVKAKEKLSKMPLTAMAAAISAMFAIDRLQGEAAYINMFFDSLAAFVRTNLPDTAAFSEFWTATLGSKTVKGGDVPGVRMMTIHKSKGLEFAHVIVPYCDWVLDLGATLWCKSSEEPYCELPVVPVNSKILRETVYQNEYFEEKLNNTVDNLNLLYVAFTRARRDLLVIGQRSVNKNGINFARRSGLVESVVRDMQQQLANCTLLYDGNDLRFEFGRLDELVATTNHSDNIFTPSKAKMTVPLAAPATQIAFRQSNRSRAFVSGEDDGGDRGQYIRQGTLLHNLLSQIADRNDADRVLDAFVAEGVLEKENRAGLAKLIRNRLEHNSNARVNEWFAPGIATLNECTILSPDPQTGRAQRLRPDRVVQLGGRTVVIDFKFAAPRPEHHAQVRNYMRLLSGMGCDVDGFLWYVYDNTVTQVTPTSTI